MKRNLVQAIAAALIFPLGLIACGESEREKEERQRQEKIKVEQVLDKKLAKLEGFYEYEIPTITIKSAKTSFTLDPFEHIKNAAKAQYITFPVSVEYQNSVAIGEKLDSQFNWGGLFNGGDFSSYSNTISNKGSTTLYCGIVNNNCEELTEKEFKALVGRGKEIGLLQSPFSWLLVRNDRKEPVDIDLSRFKDTCDVVVKTTKSNFTLDIEKHIWNSLQAMNIPLQFPRFMCENLSPDTIIDRNFVGGSLIFSRSPSVVNYKVISIKFNY